MATAPPDLEIETMEMQMPYGHRKTGKAKVALYVIQTIAALGICIAFFMALFGNFDAAHTTAQWSYGFLFAGVGAIFLIGFALLGWGWLLRRKREKAEEGRFKKRRYEKSW